MIWSAVWPTRKIPVKLNWSARAIVQCHRVPHFRYLGRPCFVCDDIVTSYAQYTESARQFSVDSTLVAPTETIVSKILFVSSAMKFHRILRQRL